MRKSSSAVTNLLYKSKIQRLPSIEKNAQSSLNTTLKENQPNMGNKDYEIIRIKSSNRLIIKQPSSTSIQEKKKLAQPHRKLVKPKLTIQEEIFSNKQIHRFFKKKRSFFPETQKQIPIQQIHPFPRKNNEIIKQSKVQRKMIVRNPFQKRQLQIQIQRLSTCDQSQIAHKSGINEDVSEIKQIVKTINEQEIN